jgi:hypothetical protein
LTQFRGLSIFSLISRINIISGKDEVIVFKPTKKYKTFDLQKRLGDFSYLKPEDSARIKFDRLQKGRHKPVWYLVIGFAAVLYFFFYLINY